MNCLNPITNTPIRNISYFAVESDNIGFDDLTDISESPLLSNVPLTSDLFNQSLAELEKCLMVEKYSVPVNSDSFSELNPPIESKPVIVSNASQTLSIQKSKKSVMVKSEASLDVKKDMDKIISGKLLVPKALSSNQLSIVKKMLPNSADMASLLSTFPMLSKRTLGSASEPSSSVCNMDKVTNMVSFKDCKSCLSLSSGPCFSIDSLKSNTSSISSRIISLTNSSDSFSSHKNNSIQSQDLLSISRELYHQSINFSESFSSENSSVTISLPFKGLFIGTDDDYLQSPIIRLLFEANALNCEATEILPFPKIKKNDNV